MDGWINFSGQLNQGGGAAHLKEHSSLKPEQQTRYNMTGALMVFPSGAMKRLQGNHQTQPKLSFPRLANDVCGPANSTPPCKRYQREGSGLLSPSRNPSPLSSNLTMG